jgi:hypothetical protein
VGGGDRFCLVCTILLSATSLTKFGQYIQMAVMISAFSKVMLGLISAECLITAVAS